MQGSSRWMLPAVLAVVALLGTGVAAAPPAVATASGGCEPLLEDPENGLDAISALGTDLHAVAADHDLSPSQLRSELRQDDTLWVDPCGDLFFVEPDMAGGDDVAAAEEPAAAPLSQTFALNSRPGARRVIYLDFDGHVLSGTSWNTSRNLPDGYVLAPYDIDGTPGTFSDAERSVIQSVWRRVAEDFAPFDVNVTTQFPGDAAITRSGVSDLDFGTRVVITNDLHMKQQCNCGGQAYVGVFDRTTNHASTQPALVYTAGVGHGAKNIAEAASHEAGHNLNLLHHGTISPSAGYYSGHTTWAPIMGVGYHRPVSQWSHGEYASASNSGQDDVNTIATRGAPLRVDDHGDTIATATPLTVHAGGATVAGVITERTDGDVFTFPARGTTTIKVTPAAEGANLDVRAELLDTDGQVVAWSDPPAAFVSKALASGLDASLLVDLPEATYHLRVTGVGHGNPLNTGYSDYGSLGVYTVQILTQTASDGPSAPSVAVSTGDRQVTLSWPVVNAPLGSGAYLYRIRRDGEVLTDTTALTWTDTGLTAGRSYRYAVTAVGPDGEGPGTETDVVAITRPAAIATRTATVGTDVGSGRVRLDWVHPTVSAATPRTGYRIYRDGVAVATTTRNTTTLTGLTNGQRYRFEIRAYGPAGETGSSAVSATPVRAPGRPGSVTAAQRDRAVRLEWPAVAGTAAAPLTGYRVSRDGVRIHQGSGTKLTVTGLTAGRSSTYEVVAYGPGGESTARSITRTAITVPNRPSSVSVSARRTSASVSFPKVTATTARPVTGYRVYVDGVRRYQGTSRTVTVSSLRADRSYTVQVVAYNAAGEGSARSRTFRTAR